MKITLADQYYLKAANFYPWRIADALENLNYALSYDEDHAQAWCLQGMVHMYSLKNYAEAQAAFNKSIRADLSHVDAYKHLTLLKIWKGETERAYKLIDYALKLESMDRAVMLGLKAMAMEIQGRYKTATDILDTAKLLSLDCDTISWLNKNQKRVKAKAKQRKKLAKQTRKEKQK